MKVKALRSFSGAVNMSRGQVKEITDKHILADLMKAGYVEEVEESDEKPSAKPKKKTKKTGGDAE